MLLSTIIIPLFYPVVIIATEQGAFVPPSESISPFDINSNSLTIKDFSRHINTSQDNLLK